MYCFCQLFRMTLGVAVSDPKDEVGPKHKLVSGAKEPPDHSKLRIST